MKYKHLSIDIETLGTKPGSIMLNVAVVPFSLRAVGVTEVFYRRISVMDSMANGLVADSDTLAWWLKQSPEAWTAVHTGEESRLKSFAKELCGYVDKYYTDDVKVWMKGPSFDGVMLRAAFEAVGETLPWQYWQERCVRTICDDIAEPNREGVHHNAIDDAVHQAKWVRDALFSKLVLEQGDKDAK